MEIEWIRTDSNQEGRQLSEKVFEFREETEPDTYRIRIVDIRLFTDDEIEDVIHSYGYTLESTRPGSQNIRELYGDESDWIIGECLFEMSN